MLTLADKRRAKDTLRNPYGLEACAILPEFDDIDGTLALVSEGIRADGFYRPGDLVLPDFDNAVLYPAAVRGAEPIEAAEYKAPLYKPPKPSEAAKAQAKFDKAWRIRREDFEQMTPVEQRTKIVFLINVGVNASEIDTGLGLESGTTLKIIREIRGG